MFDSFRFYSLKFNIFSTIGFALIILVLIFADSIVTNVSLHHDHLQIQKTSEVFVLESTADDHGYLIPPFDDVAGNHMNFHPQNRVKTGESGLFDTTGLGTRYDSRITKFFTTNQCKVQFFMTWIAPVESFGEREFFVLESLFETNPEGCLIILSTTMDSEKGLSILEPFITRGFHVKALSIDFRALFKKTPAENWFEDIKNGKKDAGEIPIEQNLSNLIRLVAMYKFGGVYLDMDFLILRDFSGLRNSIGAQSVDVNGNWTRLNNAVLVFDKNHPLVYKFIEEFASTFDGNKWGHNGPYLVSRVVDKLAKNKREFDFTILPPIAFYPVGWNRISGLFTRPNDPAGSKWVEAKVQQLKRSTYGVHLWNKQSRRFKIEEGSVIRRLISDHCVIYNV